ncbi:Alanine--glyoxylate aminotransferase 1 [Termitomyces sp. J132]|nr:Alanine--glyoxylate aminotransferase 1 [Termitomyces sp. J132]
MSSTSDFKQLPHKLLAIPGPIEVSDEVLFANATPVVSHVSPDFVKILGDAIRPTREVLFTKQAQPFLISGSGTLGWDQATNLVEPGENALVLHIGYFGDSFSDCLQTYGAEVDVLKAKLGTAAKQAAVEEALKQKKYKIVTFTHVDTSTFQWVRVLSDAKSITETVKRISAETPVFADCVCSIGSKEIRFDDWDLDIVLTASQLVRKDSERHQDLVSCFLVRKPSR